MKQLAERGAYPLLRLTFSGGHWREHRAWLRHAPLEVISEPAMIEVHARHQCDAWLGVQAPENTRDGADIPAERSSALERRTGRRIATPGHAPTRGHSRGDVLVSDAGAGPGRRNDVACVRRLPLRLVPDRLEEHARAHLASCATARRGGGSPDRRRRNGFAAVRGRSARGSRRRHRQHAGRRVLRLPGRDVGRGHDRIHGVPRDAGRPRDTGHPSSLLGRPRRRCVSRQRRRLPDRNTRHRRRRAPHRRARDRLQPRH